MAERIGIITIRQQDEYEAVLRRFPTARPSSRFRGYTETDLVDNSGHQCSVAITCCHGQGCVIAQNVATDLLLKIRPNWLLVVGIAGAVPSKDVSLGDVVCATDVCNFTVHAAQPNGDEEYHVAGAPMHCDVQVLVANLRRNDRLNGWNVPPSVPTRPVVDLANLGSSLIGDDEWQNRVRDSLDHHFRMPRNPDILAGTVACGDVLVKNPALAKELLRQHRSILAFEMELAGVQLAVHAHAPATRLLAVRGISDVVGFRRSDVWTQYACATASALTHKLIVSGLLCNRPPTDPVIRQCIEPFANILHDYLQDTQSVLGQQTVEDFIKTDTESLPLGWDDPRHARQHWWEFALDDDRLSFFPTKDLKKIAIRQIEIAMNVANNYDYTDDISGSTKLLVDQAAESRRGSGDSPRKYRWQNLRAHLATAIRLNERFLSLLDPNLRSGHV